MRDIEVYLNDFLVDLDESSRIQITYNGFDIQDPIGRLSSFTSTLVLAESKPNQQFIGMHSEKSLSAIPYQTLKITIFQSSRRIFKGTCFLKRVKGKFYLAGVTEEAGIFDKLKTFVCSQLIETLSDGNGDKTKPANHKLLDAATLYAQRNGLALPVGAGISIYAPLVDYGKQDLIPDTTVQNYSFDTTIDPWSIEILPTPNPGTVPWTWTSGNFTSGTIGLNAVTYVALNRKVQVFAGFRYVVEIAYTLSAASNTRLVLMGLNENEQVAYLGTFDSASIGSNTATFEFTSNVNYKALGVFAIRLGALNQIVVLQSLKIKDTTYVVIQDPFYLPMTNWVAIIKKAVAKVFGGTFVYDSNFTPEMKALVDVCMIQSIRDKMEYPKWFLEERNDIQQSNGTQVIGLGNNVVGFSQKIKGNFGVWASAGAWDSGYTPGNQYYSTPSMVDTDANGGFYADIRVDMVVNITTLTGAPPESWFELEIQAGVFVRSPIFGTTGRKQFSLSSRSATVDNTGALIPPWAYPKGVRIGATDLIADVHSRTGGGTATYSVHVEYARFTVTPVPYPQDEAVFMPGFILPDFTLFDLLKDYLIRTCSLLKYDSASDSLIVGSLESIINNKTGAKDWTAKRNKEVDDIEFSLPDYAQSNIFTDKEGIDNEFANMSILVDNDNVTPEKVFFESLFESITDNPVKGAPTAELRVFNYDSQLDYKQSVEPVSASEVLTVRERKFDGINAKSTLLKLRNSVVTDPEVKYGATTAATFTAATYAKWSEFKALFYPGLESSLEKVKILKRQYNLTPDDIAGFDTFTLIYDDNAYYLVINLKYVPREFTDVVIFKVN